MPAAPTPPTLEQRFDDLAERIRVIEGRLGPQGSLERVIAAASAAPAASRALDPEPENPSVGGPAWRPALSTPAIAPSPAAAHPVVSAAPPAGMAATASAPAAAPVASAADLPSSTTTQRQRHRPAARSAVDLEQLLGGRVLAWVGSVAVLAGLVMLFALGISNGWIGPAGRTILGAVASGLLLATGIWLHDRRGRTEAARSAVATGASGLFLAVTVASRVYDLIPASGGLVLAALVAAGTATLAIRWRSSVIGAIGISGALLAPVLAGAPGDVMTLAFLLVAALAGAAVVVRQDWDGLMIAVAGLPALQWLAWLGEPRPVVEIVAVLGVFGLVNAVAALGLGLRERRPDVELLPALIVGANALVLATAGFPAIEDASSHLGAVIWLAGLAAAHAAAGLAAVRHGSLTRDLGALALTISLLLADAAVALIDVGAPARTAVWALAAVAFAVAARRFANPASEPQGGTEAVAAPPRAQRMAVLGLGGQIALASIQAAIALSDDPGATSSATVVALLIAASGCMISARLVQRGLHQQRVALDVIGLSALAAATLVSFDGLALVAAWSVMALACAEVVRRSGDELARVAAGAHLAGALAIALTTVAPPSGLVDSLADIGPALAAVALISAGAVRLGLLDVPRDERVAWCGAAIVLLLYGVSLAVVSWVPASGQNPALGLGADEMAQLDLSALWAVAGVAGLVSGLRRDIQELRLGALGLLGVVIAKVFFYDLATLTAVSRVLSFIGLGVLLLGAAYAYQRLRPEAPRDLRDVPPAMR